MHVPSPWIVASPIVRGGPPRAQFQCNIGCWVVRNCHQRTCRIIREAYSQVPRRMGKTESTNSHPSFSLHASPESLRVPGNLLSVLNPLSMIPMKERLSVVNKLPYLDLFQWIFVFAQARRPSDSLQPNSDEHPEPAYGASGTLKLILWCHQEHCYCATAMALRDRRIRGHQREAQEAARLVRGISR